jgi:hypothetical protein
MRGWILLALIAAGIYYTATETTKLDAPIAKVLSIFNKAEHKLDSMTGTQIIRVQKNANQVRIQIAERLSSRELTSFNQIISSQSNIEDFKDEYCTADASHPVFSKDNLRYMCDKL